MELQRVIQRKDATYIAIHIASSMLFPLSFQELADLWQTL